MKNFNMGTTVIAFAFLSSFSLTACGGNSGSNAAPTTIDSSNKSSLNTGRGNANAEKTSLTSDEISGLLFMREEEELARDLYLDIYETRNSELQIFKNISDNAETKHAKAIRQLLKKYDIEDPSTGERNAYTDPELQYLYDQLFSIAIGSDDLAALRVGALVEETDIGDIKMHIDNVSSEHQDIISTYENLLCGSRNHLRAFAGQIENITGETYVTQVVELDSEVRAILSSNNERCGQ
ncbi:MAG: DUF2202 domain-containing protein [Gammaproteobacteria bacterium]